MIFSFDGHVGGPPESYLPYIEPQYRADLEALSAENAEWSSHCKFYGFEPGEKYGVFDSPRMLQEMDADGISGQILLNGHGMATTPFFSVSNDPYPPELRFAGAKAFHRWLADYAADGQGRLVPIADPGPCLDMDATVAELRWVRDARLPRRVPPRRGVRRRAPARTTTATTTRSGPRARSSASCSCCTRRSAPSRDACSTCSAARTAPRRSSSGATPRWRTSTSPSTPRTSCWRWAAASRRTR